MTYRQLYDYLKELLIVSKQLNELSHSDKISYEKAVELRKMHEEVYKKWLFYRTIQITMTTKSR